jgi:hypothetical protein
MADPKKSQRIASLSAPTNVPLSNGSSSLSVGNNFASGFGNASGIIEAIWDEGDRFRIVFTSGAMVLLFPTGMLAEVQQELKKP